MPTTQTANTEIRDPGNANLRIRFAATHYYVEIQKMRPLPQIETQKDGSASKIVYSDYRVINQIQEPDLIETYLDEVLQNRLIIEKSGINVSAVASLFQLPQELLED